MGRREDPTMMEVIIVFVRPLIALAVIGLSLILINKLLGGH